MTNHLADAIVQSQDHVCAVCAAEATFVKVGEYWLCSDPACADVAKGWLHRLPHPNEALKPATVWEGEAMLDAGKAGGMFLEQEVGKTDLRTLSRDEYTAFTKTIIDAYRRGLQHRGKTGAPPF